MADAVLSFLAPPPLSPLFQAGGPFEGYNEDIVLISFFLVALAVVDFCVVKRVLVPGARYWALHAAINAVSAYAAFPDVWRALSDPIHAVSGPSHTMVANSAIAAIHIYHCLAFKLRSDEIMHHAVFVVILCGLAIPFKQVGGIANNFGCFFLSGLPGGMDYVMLTLVKQGMMHGLTEKYYNTLINTYLRGPSMVVYTWLLYQAWWLGELSPGIPRVAIFMTASLHFLNGQYYSSLTSQSYGYHSRIAKQKQKQKQKKTE